MTGDQLLSAMFETALLFVVGREILWSWHYVSPRLVHNGALALLCSALIGLLLTPWLKPSLIPIWAQTVTIDPLTALPRPAASPFSAILPLLFNIYIAGIVILLFRWVISLLQLLHLLATSWVEQSSPWRAELDSLSQRQVRIIVSKRILSPMTWGLLWPVIAIPHHALNWPRNQIRWTLLHELSHIQQRDWLTQQLGRMSCILFWPIPLCWELYRTLCQEAELTADNQVLKTGAKPHEFAAWLLQQARGVRGSAGVALAPASTLEQRLQNILRSRNDARPHTFLLSLWLPLTILLAIPLAIFQFSILELPAKQPPEFVIKRQTIVPPRPAPGAALISRLSEPLHSQPSTLPPAPPAVNREPPFPRSSQAP